MSFFLNPRRLISARKFLSKGKINLKRLLASPLLWMGFVNIEYYYVHGENAGNKLFIGKNVSTLNALFNIASGNITIGDETIFGHNVSIITGYHNFHKGMLSSLKKSKSKIKEVPSNGNDIVVGNGCFLGSNCVVLKNVTIGDNSIITAGAIVTKSFPEHSIISGVPAKVIGSTLSLNK